PAGRGVAVPMRLSPWWTGLGQPRGVRLPAPWWPPWSAAHRRRGTGRAPVQGPGHVARAYIITWAISRAYEAPRPVGPAGTQSGSAAQRHGRFVYHRGSPVQPVGTLSWWQPTFLRCASKRRWAFSSPPRVPSGPATEARGALPSAAYPQQWLS